jgi:hypothetical protein
LEKNDYSFDLLALKKAHLGNHYNQREEKWPGMVLEFDRGLA